MCVAASLTHLRSSSFTNAAKYVDPSVLFWAGGSGSAEPSGWSPDEEEEEESTSSGLAMRVSDPSGRQRRVEEVQTAMAASLPAAKVSDVRLGDVSGSRTKTS